MKHLWTPWRKEYNWTTTQQELNLYWNVRRELKENLHLFMHGLNDEDEIAIQNDGPPRDGEYPTRHWRLGQTLKSQATLALSEDISSVAIGMYKP